MSDPTREAIEAAYARLREKLEAKDVSAEKLKAAALEALNTARIQAELDPSFVATELDRLRAKTDVDSK